MSAELIQRMKDAIEGECDGLVIDDTHAKAILEYVLAGAQQQAASTPVAYAVRSNVRDVHQLLLRREDADNYAAALLRAAPTHNPAITEVTVMPLYAAPTPTAPADVMADAECDAIMDALDEWARDVDVREFGLPLYSMNHDIPRELIRKALRDARAAEKGTT